tara:strand:- start:1048 stop:2061 length:1014 start_codon:yes stop_codon:yes gene_type:complete
MNFFNKKKPYIIAEIASSHEGNLDYALKLFNILTESKSHAIKFQIFNTDSFISKNNPNYEEFKKLEFSFEKWEKILLSKVKFQQDLIAEVFDLDSLEFANNLNIFNAYKIPPSCLEDSKMLEFYKTIKKPIILGVGGSTIEEITKAYQIFENEISDIVLMWGFQNFPTKAVDIKLNQIKFLQKNFNCKIGYADHTNSDESILSYVIPYLAYEMGADIIEKHITLNRGKKGNDYFSSLNPDEFNDFVSFFEILEKSKGEKNKWELNEPEKKYNTFVKKYAVANSDIKKGEVFSENNITFKRTNSIGISQKDFNHYKGKKFLKDKKNDDLILSQDLDNQ